MILRVDLQASISSFCSRHRLDHVTCLDTSLGVARRAHPCINLIGSARNAYPALIPDDPLDIRVAKDLGYIIADADGIGFDTTTRGQRDQTARLVRDKSGNIIGDSDK